MDLLWQKSHVGDKIFEAEWDSFGQISFFVIIRDKAQFQGIQNWNHEAPNLQSKWLSGGGDDDDADTDHEDSVATVQADDFGAIAFRVPAYKHEKSNKGLPACFLFGRRTTNRYADMWIGIGNRYSRSGFTISLRNGLWAIRSLDPVLRVNEDYIDKGTPPLALDHHRANEVEWMSYSRKHRMEAQIRIEIFCMEPKSTFDPVFSDEGGLTGHHPASTPTTSSSSTMTASSIADPVTMSNRERLYIYRHLELPSRNGVPKYISVDPWAFKTYVLKAYHPRKQKALKERFSLLQTLPESYHFMRDEQFRVENQNVHLLTPHDPYATALEYHTDTANPENARRLLWTLLRIVIDLHRYEIYHGDICVSTVFLASSEFDEGSIRLGGFSEISTDPTKAVDDTVGIFHTVFNYLNKQPQKPGWVGNQVLDRLWVSILNGDKCEDTPRDLFKRFGMDPSRRDEIWQEIVITSDVSIDLSPGRLVKLEVKNLVDYLRKDANRCSRPSATSKEIVTLYQTAMGAIHKLEDGFGRITVDEYHNIHTHLKERHKIKIGELLAWELPTDKSDQSSVGFTMEFKIPFHPRYGLISITHLQRLAPANSELDVFDTVPKYQVQGFKGTEGIFTISSYLPKLLDGLGLHTSQVLKTTRDTSLDRYEYPEWYLLCTNESSDLLPNRRQAGELAQPIDWEYGLMPLRWEVPLSHSCKESQIADAEMRFGFGNAARERDRANRDTRHWLRSLSRSREAINDTSGSYRCSDSGRGSETFSDVTSYARHKHGSQMLDDGMETRASGRPNDILPWAKNEHRSLALEDDLGIGASQTLEDNMGKVWSDISSGDDNDEVDFGDTQLHDSVRRDDIQKLVQNS